MDDVDAGAKPSPLLGNAPAPLLVASAILLVILLAALDYAAQPVFGLTPFYLAPLLLAAWAGGIRAGALTAGVSAVAVFTVDSERAYSLPSPLVPYWNAVTVLVFLMAVALFAHAYRKARDQQNADAWLDPLAECANARYFYHLANAELSRARRYGRRFSIAYVDIDGLRTVNARAGHQAGDALIGLVGKTLARSLRKLDSVARMGGDEFAILLPEADSTGAEVVMKRLTDTLSTIFEHDGWPVTLTFGAVTFNVAPDTVDDAVRAAEAAMYVAKMDPSLRYHHEERGEADAPAGTPPAPAAAAR